MRAQCRCYLYYTCLLLACGESSLPELAEITAVGPASVEPGDELRILGQGFVEGPVTVSLYGDFKPVGLGAPEKRRVVLKGAAVSENVVVVPLTQRVMKRIIQEPSRFFGGIEADFPVEAGAVRIFAQISGVSMDFRPGGNGVAVQARKEREAAGFLNALGLTALDSPDVEGLVVGEVRPGSAAEKTGISFGDRLLSVDGVAIANVSDIAGVPQAQNHIFEMLSRAGNVREVTIGVPSSRCVDEDEFIAILLSAVAFGFFLALSAPKRRRWDTLWLRPADPIAKAVGFAVVSLCLIMVPAATILLRSAFLVPVGLWGVNALGLVIHYLAADSRRRSILPLIFGICLLPVFVIVSGYLSSAAGLTDIVASQRHEVFGLHAASSPFALLLVVSTLFLLWPVQPAKPSWEKLSSIGAWMATGSLAATVSACFLGGWLLPFRTPPQYGDDTLLLAVGALVFLAKAWLVILTGRWLASYEALDRRAMRKSKRSWLPMIVFTACAVSAVVWTVVAPPVALVSAGHVLAAAMLVTLLSALTILATRSLLFGPSFPRNTRFAELETPPLQVK